MVDQPNDPEKILAGLLRFHEDDSSSLVNHVILEVAKDIIEGVIAPGESINSLDLAKRFATSRTPIREALIALEKEGLIDVPPRRRPTVAAPSLEQIVEIYELRAHLHSLVARKVARRADPSDLARLEAGLDRLRAAADAGDVDGYFWANVAFHSESTRISADSTLGKTLDGLGLQVLRLRRLGMSLPGRMQRSVHDHERLLLAYRERDEDLAAVLSSSIILRALDALRGSSHMKLGEPAGAHSTMTGV